MVLALIRRSAGEPFMSQRRSGASAMMAMRSPDGAKRNPGRSSEVPAVRRSSGPVRENPMLRIIVIVAVLSGSPAALAQTAMPDAENGRFVFNQVQDATLRLDTRTGQVSVCSKRPAGWACESVPDERTALENEIVRLQGENAALKKEMLARGVPLPGTSKGESTVTKPQIELKLPTEADLDRLMGFMERVWRRLIDMVQSVQRDVDKKG
jgi:hypothetical protein